MNKTPIICRMVSAGGNRYYEPINTEYVKEEYKLDDLYPWKKLSTTSFLNILNKPGLTVWKQNKGWLAGPEGKTAALKGTITHIGADRMHYGAQVNKDWIMARINKSRFKLWQLFYDSADALCYDIQKHLSGYVAFCEDKQPEILASEVMLWHPNYLWAGTGDLFAAFKTRKNNKNKVNCYIDLKTGKPNPEHAIQGVAYAMLWNAHFPEQQITHIGNVYTNDGWLKEPTYKLTVKPITDELREEWLAIVNLYQKQKGYNWQPRKQPDVASDFSISYIKQQKRSA